MSSETILIVDDEPDVLELLRFNLESEDYKVFQASEGTEALSILRDELIDLAVLDVMLPGFSGFDICKRMRADDRLREIPVIFLTARAAEGDMLDGFESGGDDYLTKPFSPKVLMAHVHAHLNRKRGGSESYRLEALELFFDRHLLKISGTRIDLSPREFAVMNALVQRRNRTVDRNTLLERGWGMETTSSPRSVDIVITRLRAKLARYGDCIRTVTSYGYQWDEEGFTHQAS